VRRKAGFTLLEVLVATVIMAVAVAGLLGNLSTSLRNASRLTEADRIAIAARRVMDELLTAPALPRLAPVSGRFDEATGIEGGWRARVAQFEAQPNAGPGAHVLDRIELEIWWMSGGERRTFALEAFRPYVLRVEDVAAP
jgi:general secretion pathway protein I